MKLLTLKQVCDKVGYSRTHVKRLAFEKEYAYIGFPKAVKHFKLFWSEDEIDDWIRLQLAKR